jgi:chaperonin cofactor prefoldin
MSSILLPLIICIFSSCYKEPLDYTKAINELKEQVNVLQNRSDSLANALKISNTNITSLTKSVDSIKLQLTSINIQLAQLNAQLSTINANITIITAQIADLNQQYAALLAQLTSILNQLSGGMPATLSSVLMAYYPFSGNAGDSSGNKLHGIVNGATLSMDRFGRANNAYAFNGKNSNIFINNTFFDIGSSEYSISMWYNLNQFLNTNNGNSSHVLFNTSPHNGLGLAINWGNSGKYSFSVGNPLVGWSYLFNVSSNANAVVSNWKYVTLNKIGNIFNLYIDGVLDRSISSPSSIINYPCKFYIGSCDPLSSNEVFNGRLDDVRIYSRALTQSEITYLAAH